MSDNTNDFSNDPRLTAYALGELDGAERAEVEALLAKDEAARRAVDEIRATAGVLAVEMKGADVASLTDAQRAAVAANAGRVAPVYRMRSARWLVAAASVAAAATIVAYTTRTSHESDVADATSAWEDTEEGALHGGASSQYPSQHAQRSAAEPDAPAPSEASPTFTAAGGSGHLGDLASASDGGRGGLGRLEDPNGASGGGGTVLLRDSKGFPINNPADALDVSKDANAPGAPGGTAIGVGVSGPGRKRVGAYSQGGGGGGGGARTAGTSGLHIGSGKPFTGRSGEGGRGGGGLGGPAGPAPAPKPAPRPGGDSATGGPNVNGVRGGQVITDSSTDLRGAAEQLKKLEGLGYVGGGLEYSAASYAHVEDNPFRAVKDAPLSTFGVDVDTASYANVRRFLNSNQLPPPGAVRIEEMVNYFPYEYAPPTDGRPFAVRVDVAGCPWKTDHRLVRVALKGKVVATAARPAANLVFLLDVSGSMQPQNRLPLVIQSMKMLLTQLEPRDRVAIVVYAGASGLVLPSTSCEDKGKILAALDSLHSGGSTNGAAGIELAYQVAGENHVEGGVNRVILATDGDFNVGVTDESSLVKLVQEKAKAGTFLSVLGVGDDNYKDSTMEMLADRGNGNYAYIDSLKEGEKTLVAQANGTLVTIAKDVKLQIEFNPSQVGSYRLIGYENRVLAAEDFKDDKKDAGEIGAGHTVTALYEVAPPGTSDTQTAGVDPLKYQTQPATGGATSRELLTVKLRWKEPTADVSTPMEVPVTDEGLSWSAASPDFKFAASVALFGMCLRQSPYRGNVTLDAVIELASEGTANDPGGHRAEFVGLVKRAKELGAK